MDVGRTASSLRGEVMADMFPSEKVKPSTCDVNGSSRYALWARTFIEWETVA